METRMDSYVLPFQWCVCDMSVGINDVICLHTGHQKVARLLFGEVMGKFHTFGDSWVRGDGVGSNNTFSWLISNS